MASVTQEFHCHGCDGYIMIRLNRELNRHLLVTCPNCGRKHERQLIGGVIKDDKTGKNDLEELILPRSAYSKTARSHVQEKASKDRGPGSNGWHKMRDGVVIDSPRSLIEESWFDRYGDRI